MFDFTAFPVSAFLIKCQTPKWRSEEPTILFRASHSGSAGSTSKEQITCGAWSETDANDSFFSQWVNGKPETHIHSHFDTGSRRPTMFISTTPELLRALNIACGFFRKGCQDVRITIVDVRAAKQDSHHDITNAMAIASLLDLPDQYFYRKEWLFLGRIRSPAIVHQVCMDQSMYDRITRIFPSLGLPNSLATLRELVKHDFAKQDPLICEGKEASDDGRRCGLLTSCFHFTPGEMEVYKVVLDQVWSWKDTIFYPDQEYKDQFLRTASMDAPREH